MSILASIAFQDTYPTTERANQKFVFISLFNNLLSNLIFTNNFKIII